MSLLIAPLSRQHDRTAFHSGIPQLDQWLKQTSSQHHEKRLSRTVVLTETGRPARILAYYALNIRGLVEAWTLPPPLTRRMPSTIPTLALGRLAVDASAQEMGHGAAMLAHAMRQAKAASDLVGGVLLLVDATDARAAAFYMKFRFCPLPNAPLTLAIPIDEIV